MKIVSTIFAGIGTIMLVVAVVMFINNRNFKENAATAMGTVIDNTSYQSTDSDGYSTTMYKPVVEFISQDGDTITFTTGYSSSSIDYYVNDPVEVFYSPDNPYDAKINSFTDQYLGVTIVGILALVFGGIGWGMVGYRISKNQLRKRLLKDGKRIDTNFVEVVHNRSLQVNGRSPYNIITHYTRGNEIFEYKSENIWFDPSNYIDFPVITVLVDPKNYKKYYMDVSFLPKMQR